MAVLSADPSALFLAWCLSHCPPVVTGRAVCHKAMTKKGVKDLSVAGTSSNISLVG